MNTILSRIQNCARKGILTASLIGVLPAFTLNQTALAQTTNDNTAEPYLGVYGGSTLYQNGVPVGNYFQSWLHRSSTWMLTFNGEYDTWANIEGSAEIIAIGKDWLQSHPNSKFILSVGMLPGISSNGGTAAMDGASRASHKRGARGDFDHHFTALAQKIVDAGIADRTLIRLGWEFNGSWYPWRVYNYDTSRPTEQANSHPDYFRAYFARIVTAMRGIKKSTVTGPGDDGANFKFVWCGSRFQTFSYSVEEAYPVDIPVSTVDPIHPAYPGNDYVEYVGLDLYDVSALYEGKDPVLADWKSAWTQSHNAYVSNKNGIPYWQDIADLHGKKMCFPEWGLSTTRDNVHPDGGFDDYYFIQKMHAYIHNPAKRVAFSIYYNYTGGEGNARIVDNASYPVASKEFRKLFGYPMANNGTVGATLTAPVSVDGITVNGAGTGCLLGTTDSFYFSSRVKAAAASGPTTDSFVVKFESESTVAGQSAIMIRQSLAADAKYAGLFYSNGILKFQSRTATTGLAAENASTPGLALPMWVKLVRIGDAITGYRSADGLNWVFAGQQTVSLSGNTYIGIGVSSGSTSTAKALTIDRLELPHPKVGDEASIPNAIVQDNSSAGNSFDALWTNATSPTGYLGSNFLKSAAGSGGVGTLKPTIPTSGMYDVYARWPAHTDFSYAVPLSVIYNNAGATATASYTVNQQSLLNRWAYLGSYNLLAGTTNGVKITAAATGLGGATTADSIMCVPLPSAPATGVNFNNYGISEYSGQDGSGTYAIQDSGATLFLNGNLWKKISFPYTITASTVLEFDFKSTAQGEVQGIGLDADNSYESGNIFSLYGTDTSLGRQTYHNYSGTNWVHYTIPIGQYVTGSRIYLFFINDKDGSPFTNTAYFRNVQVHE